jgi:hypothetical protein
MTAQKKKKEVFNDLEAGIRPQQNAQMDGGNFSITRSLFLTL